MRRVRLLAAITVVALSSWQQPAHAISDGSRAAARNLVNEGVGDFKAGRFELARSKFVQALAVAQVPTVAVWAARANERLGKLVAAVDLYEKALLMQPSDWWVGNVQRAAQSQARQALKAVKPRIPMVKISLGDAPADKVEASIDNTAIPSELLSEELPLDPGLHHIAAVLNGSKIEHEIALSEGAKQTVVFTWPGAPAPTFVPKDISPQVRMSKPPAASPTRTPVSTTSPSSQSYERRSELSVQRTTAWVTVGLGATGIVLGATEGTIVGLERSSLRADGCVGNTCPSSLAHRVHDYNTWRTISTVSLVAGSVALATGLTLLLYKPHQESGPSLSLMVLPAALNLAGTL